MLHQCVYLTFQPPTNCCTSTLITHTRPATHLSCPPYAVTAYFFPAGFAGALAGAFGSDCFADLLCAAIKSSRWSSGGCVCDTSAMVSSFWASQPPKKAQKTYLSLGVLCLRSIPIAVP